MGSNPWSRKIPWAVEMATQPCLENPLDREVWRAPVHGATHDLAMSFEIEVQKIFLSYKVCKFANDGTPRKHTDQLYKDSTDRIWDDLSVKMNCML